MGENEDYMGGAEAGRIKRWRKEEEIIERKYNNTRFKKINDESYYIIIYI